MAGLFSLPPHIVVDAFSYITYNSTQLGAFSAICRDALATLRTDSAWKHLCVKYWYATEERLRNWPALSAQGLYRALEQWVPMEGFHVMMQFYPFGLLVLVRIKEGIVSADVIRFVPRNGDFEEVLVPLFQIQLGERPDKPGLICNTAIATWLGDRSALVSSPDPSSVTVCNNITAGAFDSPRIVESRFFVPRRLFRIAAETLDTSPPRREHRSRNGYAEPRLDDDVDDDVMDDSDNLGGDQRIPELELGQLFPSASEARASTESLLHYMLKEHSVPCDLALIRSPDDFVPQDPGCPDLRPGLYVGDYGHRMYGQFRTEVLLLEHIALSHDELEAELHRPARVFARPNGEHPPPELRALVDAGVGATFMCGIKQCGDFHVPMGATTFVAVGGPSAACEALARDHTPPRSVLNRQTGNEEAVFKAWRGFGTLAVPGFRSPSWAGGWLLRFCDNDSNGDHRFGFCWDRNQDSVVLRWIAAQDSNPFLQRAWLPEELR